MFLTLSEFWNSPLNPAGMLNSPRFNFKPLLLHLNGITITKIPFQTPNPNPFPSTLSWKHSSTTSQQYPFTVSYLITNCTFSPLTANKVSNLVHFETTEKPDTVIAIFKSHGFSDSQINKIIRQAPNALSGDPQKRVLSKFEFLRSKGASISDIVEIVERSPRILYSSLENSIIPTFELLRRFLPSDEKVIERIIACRNFFGNDIVIKNVRLLIDYGVTDSNITYLLLRRPSILLTHDMGNALDEVKEMGFYPSKVYFAVALLAKRAISKSKWDAKVDVFKKWGWSQEMVLDAFRKRPLCMLVSVDKINKMMRFFVDELGWNSLALVKRPEVFSYSLERRIIPRACVIRYLISKGLIDEKNAELCTTPFAVTEKKFLDMHVKCFKMESCHLLKLYQEKMGVLKSREASVESGRQRLV